MAYAKRKYICVIVAYMAGVADTHLESNFGERADLLKQLRGDKDATIIRYLSKLRTTIMRNFKSTDDALKSTLGGISKVSYFNADEIKQLEKWGVNVTVFNGKAPDYSSNFNKLINENIDACSRLFPSWVEWSYIKGLFTMTKYNNSQAMIDEYDKFVKCSNFYPFGVYINWSPVDCSGFVRNDEIFLKTLYSQHQREFTDKSKYIEVDKTNIFSFINSSQKIVIAVDCENVDIYKLYSFLEGLSSKDKEKIERIMLFDDVNTIDTWKSLESYIDIPVEYYKVDRVLGRKSLVDMRMAVGICEAHFNRSVDSFMIVSSDSDYYTVISSLPNANFMVVYENEKVSQVVLEVYDKESVAHCSLDECYSGSSTNLKEKVIYDEINEELGNICFDLKSVLTKIYKTNNMNVTDDEDSAFFKKVSSGIKLVSSKEGVFSLKYKS